jgi:cytochrome c nitrite reductase small subunit
MPGAEAPRRTLRAWARPTMLAACLGGGIVAGTGLFTFGYAEGISYFSDDPAACANCHVMVDHFDAWQRSSHHSAAVCNDCHAPESLIPKYWVKGVNGWNHSVAFVSGRHPDPFQITTMNIRVAEQNCRRCHDDLTHTIDPGVAEMSCIRCHAGVGH